MPVAEKYDIPVAIEPLRPEECNAINTVDDGVEILLNKKAGIMDKNGKFTKGTVNYEVQQGLARYYKSYAHYAKETHGCLGK